MVLNESSYGDKSYKVVLSWKEHGWKIRCSDKRYSDKEYLNERC